MPNFWKISVFVFSKTAALPLLSEHDALDMLVLLPINMYTAVVLLLADFYLPSHLPSLISYSNDALVCSKAPTWDVVCHAFFWVFWLLKFNPDCLLFGPFGACS